MIERLRALAEEPLDPELLRTAVVVAASIFIGLAALLILAVGTPDPSTQSGDGDGPAPVASVQIAPPSAGYPQGDRVALRPDRRQDPQDVVGSAAARRASRALRSLRALQYVPYRRAGLVIELVGARGERAVLRVSAPTVRAAREGWRRFLRRHRDSGAAYLPRFVATKAESQGEIVNFGGHLARGRR